MPEKILTLCKKLGINTMKDLYYFNRHVMCKGETFLQALERYDMEVNGCAFGTQN